MALTPGARLGPYEVTAQIGEGGMGEVYRATDTNLKRAVALKVLPASIAGDAERLARFQREAEVVAALNHSHIAAIYGLERSDGTTALVMELVEGPTLADCIAQGPIPVDEALPIAKQIAAALEAAHEHGIIHRDLKPANVKVRPDGTVKVLDFGLAKALEPKGAMSPGVSQSPTITTPAMTQAGMILGTAAYMSPEQARGKPVDKRADIWAFGCVLYEMLAGTRAFRGETVSETLADVLKSEPLWTALPPETPGALRNLVRRCLEKDPQQRVRDIGDVRLALEGAFETAVAVETTALAVPRHRVWQRPLPLAIAIVTVSLLTGLVIWALTRPAPLRVVRWKVTPSGEEDRGIAISPDGTRVAYVGAGGKQIFVRTLDRLAPTALQGGDDPFSLFFSPDSQWIGFFDGTTALKKVAITGGPPLTVSRTTANSLGASWSVDDTIVFATNEPTSGLLRVAAAGGEAEVLTMPNPALGELDHVFPEVLPRGQAALFTIATTGGPQVAVLDLTTREQKVLIRGGSDARYVPTGHLVYAVDAGPLRAVAFDLRRLEVVGASVPLLELANTSQAFSVLPVRGANMSISSDGTLFYMSAEAQAESRSTLVWVDRQGREEPLKAPPHFYRYPRLSPDGTRVALDVVAEDTADRDIWIWDVARETLTRFTFDPRADSHPVWTPDGQRVVFRSQRSGPSNLFWQAADGTGAAERLTENPKNEQFPSGFSPDGTRLVFREETAATAADLMVLAMDGDRQAPSPVQGAGGPRGSSASTVRPLVQTMFNEMNGEISPDGRWVAYQSNESGRDEIYVRPFPNADGGRSQVSTGGGERPLWAPSGKELFYLSPDGTVLGVPVDVAGGARFRVGTPSKLAEGRYVVGPRNAGRNYDVSTDGMRFLMVKEDATFVPREIVVVQNWFEELKRLVPTN